MRLVRETHFPVQAPAKPGSHGNCELFESHQSRHHQISGAYLDGHEIDLNQGAILATGHLGLPACRMMYNVRRSLQESRDSWSLLNSTWATATRENQQDLHEQGTWDTDGEGQPYCVDTRIVRAMSSKSNLESANGNHLHNIKIWKLNPEVETSPVCMNERVEFTVGRKVWFGICR